MLLFFFLFAVFALVVAVARRFALAMSGLLYVWEHQQDQLELHIQGLLTRRYELTLYAQLIALVRLC